MENGREEFRKAVYKALIDKGNKTTGWLAKEINAATGKHFDSGYLSKVFSGRRGSRCVIVETCRILGLSLPEEYKQ